jgi:hypothetical protein
LDLYRYDTNPASKIGLILQLWPFFRQALTGKVTGLVARGGVEVDIEWKDGELIDCELRSDHDTALLKVSYDGTTVGMSLKAGKPTKVFASKDADKVL